MSLEELAFASQIIAAIAIIVSLIYAALQFRVYQASAREARLVAVSADINQFRLLLMSNRDAQEVYMNGLRDMAALQPADRWRFGAMMDYCIMNTHLAAQIDPSPDTGVARALREQMRSPGAQQWWQRTGSRHPASVQSMVDVTIKNLPQPAGPQ